MASETSLAIITVFLLLILLVLCLLLLRYTDAKRLLARCLGWRELDEEKAILREDSFSPDAKFSLGPSMNQPTSTVSYQEIGGRTTPELEACKPPPHSKSEYAADYRSAVEANDDDSQPLQEKNKDSLEVGERCGRRTPESPRRSFAELPVHGLSEDGNRRSSVSSNDSFLEQLDESSMTTKISRAYSSESIDSSCSALELSNEDQELGQLEVRLYYESAAQMLYLWVLQGCDLKVRVERADLWVVIFLLPHPKPLWRTQLRSDLHNPRFHEEFKQCVRHKDLARVALLCQMYFRPSGDTQAQLLGQTRVRLKDITLLTPNVLWLAILPPSTESEERSFGEILLSLNYLPTAERLTIVLSKIRNLSGQNGQIPKRVFVRTYLVQGSKVSKKKTSVKEVEEKSVNFNESMIFNLPQKLFAKVYVRLSVTEALEDGGQRTIGHVTLGARTTNKELGHWQKMAEQPRKPIVMWHSIFPKKS